MKRFSIFEKNLNAITTMSIVYYLNKCFQKGFCRHNAQNNIFPFSKQNSKLSTYRVSLSENGLALETYHILRSVLTLS
jgi:hypothetical protein